MHDASSFITLTYANEHLPDPPSLDYSHYQKFMKRLRKEVGPIRYYACGEYGDNNFRPHFHACLFGIDFSKDRKFFDTSPSGHPLYRSPTLERIWPWGFSSIADLSFESAAYVARYCLKKITGDESEHHYRHVNHDTGEVTQLTPEFARMSLKPGIGGRWFDLYSSDVYNGHDYVVVNGKQCRPPRYFDRLLERSDPVRYEEVKTDRVKSAEKYLDNNTPERLAIREELKYASLQQTAKRNTL